MKQIILGTAGHVDHGKTSLIKALTGVDLDRLKEEKERGITIELGFTSLTLPSEERLGIVDVPGHEKFIKNMVAGVGGIDLVLFIIAADEGIMPQTREHLDICTLLNVTNGLIAVTKRDLVDKEWLQMVQEEIREFTRGTFLENRPIVPVSSATMEGMPHLLSALDEVVKEMAARKTGGILRLPIDRVFTMKGFGTVVTGTLVSGEISVGDTVAVLPPGIKAKVRGIQVHNKKVEKATAGLRTAINLQGVEKALLERGNVMTLPDLLHPTRRIDCHLTHLAHANKPLKNASRVKFHTGTVECESLITLLDRDELLPGEKAFVQVRFDHPIVVLPNDRFVIRSYSPLSTVGGGEILDPLPAKHKRLSPEVLESLRIIQSQNIEKIIEIYLLESKFNGKSIQELGARLGVHPKDLSPILQKMVEKRSIILFDHDTFKAISRSHYEGLKRVTLKELKGYHESNPLKKGILKEELKSKLPRVVDAKLYNHLITCLSQEGSIQMEKDKLWLSGYAPLLEGRQKEMRERIVKIYEESGLQPPTVKDLVSQLSGKEDEVKNILGLLTGEGTLIKVKEDLFFHEQAINRLKDQLMVSLKSKGEIDAPQFKELSQVSRKYAIPLLEYFDSIKLTVRVGDKRILRERRR
ncbi:MAG: selenocysteine-specific translation elongation factor [Proteobacteria bacterium]|nr:selenocysteine-specific translation elongation factor [Pseudomonadota bacterium]